jgi:hypothetical protein
MNKDESSVAFFVSRILLATLSYCATSAQPSVHPLAHRQTVRLIWPWACVHCMKPENFLKKPIPEALVQYDSSTGDGENERSRSDKQTDGNVNLKLRWLTMARQSISCTSTPLVHHSTVPIEIEIKPVQSPNPTPSPKPGCRCNSTHERDRRYMASELQ